MTHGGPNIKEFESKQSPHGIMQLKEKNYTIHSFYDSQTPITELFVQPLQLLKVLEEIYNFHFFYTTAPP